MTHLADEELLRRAVNESRNDVDPLLSISLSCAVPLWISEVRGWDWKKREAKAHAASHEICYGEGAADVATAGKERGKKKPRKGAAAEVFNSIAMGLAILAYCPGGVTFAGEHWEAHDKTKEPEPVDDIDWDTGRPL